MDVSVVQKAKLYDNKMLPDWNDEKIRELKEKYSKYEELAKRQSHISRTKFSFEEMKKTLLSYLNLIPKPVEIKLPQLKKIELPKLKKVD
jgi:hypothetical protein